MTGPRKTNVPSRKKCSLSKVHRRKKAEWGWEHKRRGEILSTVPGILGLFCILAPLSQLPLSGKKAAFIEAGALYSTRVCITNREHRITTPL